MFSLDILFGCSLIKNPGLKQFSHGLLVAFSSFFQSDVIGLVFASSASSLLLFFVVVDVLGASFDCLLFFTQITFDQKGNADWGEIFWPSQNK